MDLELGVLIDLEEKSVTDADDVITVTGYASVFGNKDLGNDIVMPGAFADSLTKRTPMFFFNHKMDDAPIGTIVEAKEDGYGLWYKGEMPKDDAFVKGRLGPQLRRKGIRGNSIGYRVREKSHKDGARLIHKADLIEISLVNMPMNTLARVDSVKAERLAIKDWNEFTDREREASLKSLGCSDELAKRIVRLEREARGQKSRREAGEGVGGMPDIAATILSFAK